MGVETQGKDREEKIMMHKEWKIDDLKMEKVYSEADGRWSVYSQKFDVNYSSILTKLIQEAGRWCESYASDLFIDWISLENKLENREYKGGKFMFGFRKYGVDHAEYILNQLNNGCSSDYYRSVWLLEISVEDEDKMIMKLGKVNL